MKSPVFPDYTNCPVNIANSILKHFKCTQFHPGLPVLDEILEQNNYKHVILYLADGMGCAQMEHHLSEDSFLRKHVVLEMSSVFPATTTASTTTYTTGLLPNEHGWLGWNMYIKDIDDIVTLFRNCRRDSFVPYTFSEDYAEERYPNHYLHQIINKTGDGKGYFYFPFKWTKYPDHEVLRNEVLRLCKKDEKNYLYLYDTEPDSTLHRDGAKSVTARHKIQAINDWIESISKELKDTLVIVCADHGHLDVTPVYVSDAPEIEKMMIRETSLEPRAAAFHIKEEFKPYFKEEFFKVFSKDDFVVYSSQEIKEMKLFGAGASREGFDDSIGDFIAIAISDKFIIDNPDSFTLKSHHAGLTPDELRIPLILIDCK